jgi:hypothetical protein
MLRKAENISHYAVFVALVKTHNGRAPYPGNDKGKRK